MSTTNEKAKQDFMEACKKDHDEATCERMWNDSKATVPPMPKIPNQDYASLAKDYEDLKIKYDKVVAQLRQAIDVATNFNARLQAEKDAKKEELANSIFYDAKGQFTKEQLTTKTLDELKAIRLGMDAVTEKTFASIAADKFAAPTQKPKLTVGEWDPETKTWKGGK